MVSFVDFINWKRFKLGILTCIISKSSLDCIWNDSWNSSENFHFKFIRSQREKPIVDSFYPHHHQTLSRFWIETFSFRPIFSPEQNKWVRQCHVVTGQVHVRVQHVRYIPGVHRGFHRGSRASSRYGTGEKKCIGQFIRLRVVCVQAPRGRRRREQWRITGRPVQNLLTLSNAAIVYENVKTSVANSHGEKSIS